MENFRVFGNSMDCSVVSTYVFALLVFLLYFTITLPSFRLYGILLCACVVGLLGMIIRTHYERIIRRRQARRALARELRRRRRLTNNEIEMLRSFSFDSAESYVSNIEEGGEQSSRKTVSTLTCDSSKTGCIICLSDYELNDEVLELPCFHCFHKACVSQWLTKNARCPICKANVTPPPHTRPFVTITSTPVDSQSNTVLSTSSSGCMESLSLSHSQSNGSNTTISNILDSSSSHELVNPLIAHSMDSIV